MAQESTKRVIVKDLAKAFLTTPEEDMPEEKKALSKKSAVKEKKPVVKAADIAASIRKKEAEKLQEIKQEENKKDSAMVILAPIVHRTKMTEGGIVKKIPEYKKANPIKKPEDAMLIIAEKRKASAKKIAVPAEAEKKVVKEEVKEVAAPAAVVTEAPKKEVVKKETPKKETAKKAAAKKEVSKKEAVKKEAPKKEAVKKEPAKKVAPKKETVKKEVSKKEASAKQNIYIEYQSFSYDQTAIEKKAEEIWTKDMKKKLSDMKTMELYIKPEEHKTYYVFNKTITGGFDI